MNEGLKRKLQVLIGLIILLIAMIASYFSVVEGDGFTKYDVFLTLDISGSMDDPTKLGAAKMAAIEFLDIVSSNQTIDFRVGLVTFESYVELVCPLTRDVDTLKSGIDQLIADGGTAMGEAIKLAGNLLIQEQMPGVGKAIIVLTDGQSNEGIEPIRATNDLSGNDIVVYTIGYGWDADTQTLKSVASISHGKYFFASTGQELIDAFSTIASLLISPIAHYGSRTLILIALPVLLFLPAIEKGVTTIIEVASTTIFKRPPREQKPTKVRGEGMRTVARPDPTVAIERKILCQKCEHMNRKTATFCAKCGSTLEQELKVTFCGKCGHKNRGSAKFCSRCGNQLGKGGPLK